MIDFKNSSVIKLKKASDSILSDVSKDLAPLLLEDETIIGAYKSIRDYVAFTNKRVVSVNIQGLSGKKKDFTSMPYSKISVFSVETAGTFDLDSELEMYFSGVGMVKFEFSGSSDIVAIGKTISSFCLK